MECEQVARNPEMIFPIKKRMTNELLIDRTVALFKRETQIRDTNNEWIVRELGFSDWRNVYTLR